LHPTRKCLEVDPIPGIKYSHKKDGVIGTFICHIMFQDKNRVVAPPVKSLCQRLDDYTHLSFRLRRPKRIKNSKIEKKKNFPILFISIDLGILIEKISFHNLFRYFLYAMP
jgi:hypothetical protein